MSLKRKLFAKWLQWFLSPPLGFQHGHRGVTVGKFPLLFWVNYFFLAHFTVRIFIFGVVAIAPTAFMMLVGFKSGMFLIGFSVTAWIIVCTVVGFFICPRLDLACDISERVECGSRFEINYTLRNSGKLTARNVYIETLPYSALFRLTSKRVTVGTVDAGESVSVKGWSKVRVRGVYTLPNLRWDSDYPGGFWRWGRTQAERRVLHVYPRYARLDNLEIPLGSGDRGELSSENKLSREAFEFHGCREFREGDLLRHVHPRSSARLGVPVVKEFQSEGRLRTAVLVDTTESGWLGRTGSRLLSNSTLEAALSLATSIVDFLSSTDRVIELLAAGSDVYRFVSSGRTGYFEEVLDIFASIESGKGDPFEKLEPMLMEEIRLIQSVCLVLTCWNDNRENLIKILDACGVGIKVVMITPDGRRPASLPIDIPCFSARSVLKGNVCSL